MAKVKLLLRNICITNKKHTTDYESVALPSELWWLLVRNTHTIRKVREKQREEFGCQVLRIYIKSSTPTPKESSNEEQMFKKEYIQSSLCLELEVDYLRITIFSIGESLFFDLTL